MQMRRVSIRYVTGYNDNKNNYVNYEKHYVECNYM